MVVEVTMSMKPVRNGICSVCALPVSEHFTARNEMRGCRYARRLEAVERVKAFAADEPHAELLTRLLTGSVIDLDEFTLAELRQVDALIGELWNHWTEAAGYDDPVATLIQELDAAVESEIDARIAAYWPAWPEPVL